LEGVEEIARAMFDLFDQDKSGEIQRFEMEETLGKFGVKVTPEEFDLLMSELDPNGDGKVTFEEFLELLHKHNFTGN